MLVRLGWSRFELVLTAVMVLITICFVVFICAFKVMDRDFWWHITAGRIMTEQKSLIYEEPFSYTRAGQPYLARYEWLSQVFLYGVHQLGGINGVIVFRTLAVATVALTLLLIDRKRMWLTSLLVIAAVNIGRSSYMDRPQLFTFLLFAWALWLIFRYLDLADAKGRRSILWWFIPLQIAWVNFHGAAAVVGLMLLMWLAAQELYDAWHVAGLRQRFFGELRFFSLLLLGAVAATFVSPNTYHNFTYLFSLLNDRTIEFIAEWQPRETDVYLRQLGPWWLLSVPLLLATRRKWIFCSLLLAGMGYLSVQAFRHEILFALAATGVIIYQLKWSSWWHSFTTWLLKKPWLLFILLASCLVLLGYYTRNRYHNFALREHIHGYGAHELAKGAYDFIAREQVEGNMFNTYGIGGYLIYRGYPERKVYIDGRNVDYGYDFLEQTFQAGFNPDVWRQLEERYSITYAIIDYDAINDIDRLPYSAHLDTNPDWHLVYLDDWAAVYIKEWDSHAPIIKQHDYSLLRPEELHLGTLLKNTKSDQYPELRAELLRAADASPASIRARLALGQLALHDKKLDEAERWFREAIEQQPYRADGYALLAAVKISQEQWTEGARLYHRSIRLAGNAYPDINYGFVAGVFEKADRPWMARWYGFLAARKAASSPTPLATLNPSVKPATPAQDIGAALKMDLQQNAARDFEELYTQAISALEKNEKDKAKALFEDALKIDPQAPAVLNNLGSLALEEENIEEAIDFYERALAIKEDYGEARHNLALALYLSGQYEEAHRQASEAKRLGQDTAQLDQLLKRAE